METVGGRPWFRGAVELLDVRQKDRLLAIDCDVLEGRALRSLVGRSVQVMLVVRDRQDAEQLAAFGWEQVRVLAHTADGSESFGTFDAMLIAPALGPVLPAHAYAELARRNLRPGGRFVVDLPALDMVPDVTAACAELGWPVERMAPLHGSAEEPVAAALRDARLRNVHAALGTHLLHFDAPAELAARFGDVLRIDDDEHAELAHALTRRRGGTGPLDTLLHRTRLSGQR